MGQNQNVTFQLSFGTCRNVDFQGKSALRPYSSGHCHLTFGCCVTVLAIFLFSGAVLWAQAPDLSKAGTNHEACQQSSSSPQTELKTDEQGNEKKPNRDAENTCTQNSKSELKGRQTQRMFWVIPNFAAVSANTHLPPLSVRGKFRLATQDSFDYSSFVWAGIIAGQEFGLNDYPEFGHGMAGYGRYYFTEAIVPWITHEDPRYYTLEHGSILRRVGYALSRVVLTKMDSGGTGFNWSEIGGNALVAGLSNAYYPPDERGLRHTGLDWGAQLEVAAVDNIAVEFWPDIRRLVFRRK